MTISRQLAAIMFTDIVGYSALMGDDKERAFELTQKNRQDRISRRGGKIRFNLSAAPNFAARLKEGGIEDLEAYQERNWIKL